MVRVHLDHDDYSRLDSEMRRIGYHTHVLAVVSGDGVDEERHLQLPPGAYWREEPTDEVVMRDEVQAALTALGELGAQVVATAGPSAWWGLIPVDWPS